jgi:hypothetical protein
MSSSSSIVKFPKAEKKHKMILTWAEGGGISFSLLACFVCLYRGLGRLAEYWQVIVVRWSNPFEEWDMVGL